MKIIIPKQLGNQLKKELAWQTAVNQLCLNVENLFVNSPEFFPDYTIHGIDHINEVLEHANRLIVKKTLSKLTSRDVAFLISAIVLHDLGMFLRIDGVRKLVRGERCRDCIPNTTDAPWDETWIEFVDRTKRYPEEKMCYLFGRNIAVKEDCVDSENMTDDERRIIGDFLRQHHPRIAHEIALNGLPGSENIDVFAGIKLERDDRDMIGLLARSHGMPIRDTEDYIRRTFGSSTYNTPVYYLMAVLRIADFLDASKQRAPVERQQHQEIPVPISVEEWTWNQRINRDNCGWDEDKKNRYIYAKPESSIEYVQLDKWLKSVQLELDLAWSVLAEKYPNNPYRLSIHRITCNIHEPDVQETMNRQFLTEEVKVTANPEITRLMIAPLYGDNPTYGVRELIQNAVDACLERKHREPGHQGLVTIRIDPWEDPKTHENLGVFTIEDNGIGMNAHVLMNYYLSAGASYRSSEEWKRDNTVDGRAQVARTGQFGVGFLAAFLLGNSVTVTTQHLNDDQGYTFEFTNKSKPLNITRKKRGQGTGTTIRIALKPGVLENLKGEKQCPWHNWYAFDEPEVQYFLNGEQVKHKGIPLSRDPNHNPAWLPLESKTFDAYMWHPGIDAKRPEFYCNGIRVYDTQKDETFEDCGLNVPFPHVSLLDPNAELNINLARSQLQTFPDEDRLLEQTFRYHIARLLMIPWETEEDFRRNLGLGFCLRSSDEYGRIPFLFAQQSFTLNYASVLSVMEIHQFVILYYDRTDTKESVKTAYHFVPSHVPVSIAISRDMAMDSQEKIQYLNYCTYGSPGEFVEKILSYNRRLFDMKAIQYDLSNYSGCFQILESLSSKVSFDKWHGKAQYRGILGDMLIYEFRDEFTDEFSNLFTSLPTPDSLATVPLDAAAFPVVMQLSPGIFALLSDNNATSLFPQTLQELLGPNAAHPDRDMWIPFDMEERKKKFPEAFEELKPYFDYIKRNPTP